MNWRPSLLLLLPLAGLPALQADTVTPDNVKAALTKAGVTYQASEDTSGDLMFDLKYDGFNARVVTYMVGESKTDIARLSWTSAIDYKDGMKPEAVNSWNEANLDIKVYLDADSDPVLESNHTVEGGVTEANMVAWLTQVKAEADEFFAEHGPAVGPKGTSGSKPH
ncbi:MAG: YbjN domain-containing protein [Fimbriimonadaceae bacterium]|nr:YbjN domain-containing protein [Fimbriimonadaceae bacterium]